MKSTFVSLCPSRHLKFGMLIHHKQAYTLYVHVEDNKHCDSQALLVIYKYVRHLNIINIFNKGRLLRCIFLNV